MLKKVLSLLLISVMVLATFSACKSDENTISKEDLTEPQVFTYNMGADPETLDPGKASENVGFTVLVNVFEGLTRLDNNDTAIPGVAKKWEGNEDATEYIFTLREDAKWSDGEIVTAEDFVYAWRRAVDPKNATDYAYQLFYLKNAEAIVGGEKDISELGVEALDEYTLKVTLENPCSWMLEMFAFPTYYPVRKDVVEANPDTWALEAETIVSNGAFKVKHWSHSEEVVMIPNENYWDADRILLDEFRMTLITEESTALAAFETGDIDGSDGVPVTEIPRLLAEEDDFEILPYIGLYYYTFNNEEPPFDNEKVRKAFSYAIDRKKIVGTITMGGEKPATGVVPNGIFVGEEEFRKAGDDYGIKPDAQIEEAKKLLEEAGYPNGEGLPKITLRYNTSERHKKIAEAVQEMWKQNLGVKVELVNTEWNVHLKNLEEGNYQIGRIGWIGDYAHPMTFIDLFIAASGNNYTNWSSDEYDNLVRDSKSTLNTKEASEYMHKAEDIFMNRHTVIPIYFYTNPELVRSYVKNWHKSRLGYLFVDKVYIEGRE